MPSGEHPNSHKHLKRFKKGQSGNPNGRPKTLVNHIINELYTEGYERVTPFHVRECYLMMLNLPEDKLTKIRDDKKAPMLMRIVSKELLKSRAFEAVETILQRAIGAPKQAVELTKTVRTIQLVSAKEYLAAKNDSE